MANEPIQQQPEHDEPAHAFDTHEPNYKVVWLFSLLCLVLFVVMVAAVYQYYDIYTENAVYKTVLAPPSGELKAVRDREDRELHTYGVADKAKGTVRIPIDRAMELLVNDAKENRLKYPTSAYAVTSTATNAGGAPSQPGGGANQGPAGSSAASTGTTAANSGSTNTATGAPSNQK